MKTVLKFLKPHWLVIIGILILLVGRAWCELTLPSYTADIVDTGISSEGVENPIPTVLQEKFFNQILNLSDEPTKEALQSMYVKNNSGYYELSVDADENYDILYNALKVPVMELAAAKMVKTNKEILARLGREMTDEEAMALVADKRAELSSTPDSLLEQALTQFTLQQMKACKIDVGQIQKYYLFEKAQQMILITFIQMLTMIICSYLASKTASKIAYRMREGVFKKVIGFSNTEIDKFSSASLITRCTNDIQQVQMFLVMLLSMVLFAPIIAVGGIIKVNETKASMSWIIALAVGLLFLLVLTLLIFAMPKFKQIQPKTDALQLVSREILTGLPVIRAFTREENENKRFAKANKDLTMLHVFVGRAMSVMMPCMMLLMNLVVVLIIWVGGHRISEGTTQVGDLLAFINYTILIIFSFLMLTMISIMAPRAIVAANRIGDVINTKSSIKNKENTIDNDRKGVVQFKNVTFKYSDGDGENVLEDISFTALPNQTTAIIGGTGSGKTSLISLIPRLYDVSGGSVTVDDVDVRDMQLHKLREQIAFVPQKGFLFSGTIESNIKYSGDVSDETMEKSAEIAQSSDFIAEKDDKFLTEISQGGSNVSGGQRQRLCIARALAKNAKIQIYDDSFSALDYKTDAKLRAALKEHCKDTTVIIVAQRINTILNADKIIVIEDGKIAGQGTHTELLKNCEAYLEIAKSQLSNEELQKGGC